MEERSPRFPFIPLEEAVEQLRKIRQKHGRAVVSGEQALAALGYSGPHGAALKVLAALKRYGLIEKKGRALRCSDLGCRILKCDSAPEKVSLLQRAALAPGMFRRIWRRARHLGREELMEQLLLRGFTESGARRASEVYAANSSFAGLAEMEVEPAPVERPQEENPWLGFGGARDCRAREEKHPGSGAHPNVLRLPLGSGHASIPIGISEDEFRLLLETLNLWRPRLVSPLPKS